MANDDLNTDQDINNTPPNRPDDYAIRYRGGSNPDLDVAGSADQSGQSGQSGHPHDDEHLGNDDRTGPSNTSTGGGFDNNADGANADAPVMRRGGDLGSTDVMSGDAQTATDVMSGDPQTDGAEQVSQARTDTTLNEDYSTGPRRTDPERELLNPGYDPQADRNTMGPNRADDRVSPRLPGLPDQRGTLDQTTYSTESNELEADTGTGSKTGLP